MAVGTFNIPPERQWEREGAGQGTRDLSRSTRDWAERNAGPLTAGAGVATALALRNPLIRAGRTIYSKSGAKDFLRDKGIHKRESKGTGDSFRFEPRWRDATSLEELRRAGQRDAGRAKEDRIEESFQDKIRALRKAQEADGQTGTSFSIDGDPGKYGGVQQDIETELRLGSGDVLEGKDLSRDRSLRRPLGDESGLKIVDKASRLYDELRRRLATKKEDIAGRNPSLIPLFGGGKDLFNLFDVGDDPDLQAIEGHITEGNEVQRLAEDQRRALERYKQKNPVTDAIIEGPLPEQIIHDVDVGQEILRQHALDVLKNTGRIQGPGNENPVIDWLIRKLGKKRNIKQTPFGNPADYSVDRGPGDSWGPPKR
jgi:hypothetical protein